ncbi:hypothetical protein CLV51_10968 [Chitinophaga niastensis]|uniref:Uncharacterized protein n=1 Tax=Chitinophaga niastensis TaxID=536980 RepID=A0A2P8HA34_CHINA|nr:hypothetical protein [Chitinophaga niastensis]PSL43074.1 hypothetical protein CLV51_10968 [Chitinophaga niastensis]
MRIFIKQWLMTVVLSVTGMICFGQNIKMGDNLGNHKATDSLRMQGKPIDSASAIGVGIYAPNSKALLDLTSPAGAGNGKGLLLPRITDTTGIANPVPAGMMIYSASDGKVYYHDQVRWVQNLASSFVKKTSNTYVLTQNTGGSSTSAGTYLGLASASTISNSATYNRNGYYGLSELQIQVAAGQVCTFEYYLPVTTVGLINPSYPVTGTTAVEGNVGFQGVSSADVFSACVYEPTGGGINAVITGTILNNILPMQGQMDGTPGYIAYFIKVSGVFKPVANATLTLAVANDYPGDWPIAYLAGATVTYILN